MSCQVTATWISTLRRFASKIPIASWTPSSQCPLKVCCVSMRVCSLGSFGTTVMLTFREKIRVKLGEMPDNASWGNIDWLG